MTTRLVPGHRAPDLSLTNQSGAQVSLTDLLGHDVIVYFFPRAFTPGCTTEVCDFRDRRRELDRAGYHVLGVSGDSAARLAEFHEANGLAHDLLSDPDHEAARRWGAFGPKTVNGQHVVGPLRSTFTIDATGVLRSADYEVVADGHVESLVRDLVSTTGSAPSPSTATGSKARG